MSTQHNYLDDDDDFSEFYNNPLYKRVSELTPHERKNACPPPPLPTPRRDNGPRVVARKRSSRHPSPRPPSPRQPSPRPPSSSRDAAAVRASIRRHSFTKPRQTPNKENAPEPEGTHSPILRPRADHDFQQNVARVHGPEHVDKYENCADMSEKAKEELEDKPEGSLRFGRPWTQEEFDKATLIGSSDDSITDKVEKEFQENMDDEEMTLEGYEDLKEGETLEDDEILEEIEIVDWKKPNSRKLMTRERSSEDHNADLAGEQQA
ncbi:uncharacterized protein FMAN_09392 [Fusarium mangiferae]|uniref:Uncharacterized protein n=1 Tax=Fusarium mangiferae TaxID=192010 RepID=A0A1L7SXN9_FUSMA|nr:uncharacterized protein FMAN_09392 [Fusarium mangiferae]CVK91248.1 uncharacterized protein FMAN_09392 [Fusarium mangiferae]